MLNKTKVAAITLLISLALASVPAMLLAQGQIQTSQAEQLVELAERAGQHVQDLIDMLNADEESLAQIDAVGLTEEFEENKALFATGLANLANAQDALTDSDDQATVDYAVEALRVFRGVYSSIHVIMEAADLKKGDLIENQELLEAITRELQRIDRLRELLPDETPEEVLALLDAAEESLGDARTLLLDDNVTSARSAFLEAKEDISQVYQYLKEQAEASNEWRLSNYCEGLQQRIRERFRYGQDQGVDFTGVLQSYGYQSETQFMEALQNGTQTALGEQDFGDALQDCEGLSQMVQQMEQALNQEINRYQGQNGPGGSGLGYGGSGNGYGGNSASP